MARVLIAGCGDLGSRLGERLRAQGHVVWGLRRSVALLPVGLEPIPADLLRPESLVLPRELHFAYYTAAASGPDPASYRDAYVTGLSNFLAALAPSVSSLRRVLFTSSTAVYGQTQGEWVDEQSTTAPEPGAGQILLAGERLLLGSAYRGVVVRLSGLYGPGRRSLVDSVLNGSARFGVPRFTNRIHVDDAASFLAHLITLEEPERLYVASDDEPADRNEVLRWIAARAGRPSSDLLVGGPAAPLSRRAASSNKRCSNARLRATGFLLRFPSYRDGYGEIIDEALSK